MVLADKAFRYTYLGGTLLRTIDLYRGIKPPCHEFDSYSNPEYQTALEKASALLEKLKEYNVPQDLILEIEDAHSNLTATELDLMWCFAFEKGMAFQRNLGREPKDYDISAK